MKKLKSILSGVFQTVKFFVLSGLFNIAMALEIISRTALTPRNLQLIFFHCIMALFMAIFYWGHKIVDSQRDLVAAQLAANEGCLTTINLQSTQIRYLENQTQTLKEISINNIKRNIALGKIVGNQIDAESILESIADKLGVDD